MAVFDTVGEAIFSADEEGKILSVNSEAARLWEYEIKDLLGQSVDYLFSEPGFFHEAREQSIERRADDGDLRRGARPSRATGAVSRRRSRLTAPRSMA